MSSELVGIELQLKGYEGVMSDMRALDQMLNGFRGRRNKIEIETNLAKSKKEVVALQGELNKLKQIQYDLGNKGIKSDGLNNKIKETTQRLREAQQATRELQYALRNFQGTSFKQAFDKISSSVAHLGSAMQSAGNALTRLTSPFANFTKGIIMGAGYKALNKVTEGFDNAFTRVDTMRKYPRVMQSFGYSADEAQKSIDKLDASVQGLPTALDDIVNMSQRFTMTVGDLNKGTDLAIAANNAFLASMSTETQQYQGMMQLQDVLGGKKMNAREWYSLANSMMPAIRMMGESLGLEGQALDDYVSKVQQGKIANKEFIDTLIKAGVDENGKIRQVAMEAMDTWEAFFSRIRTASSRMGAGVIQAFDSIVETVTKGKFKSVNLLLDKYIVGGINKMNEATQKWIKSHPKEIAEFFKSLKSINWGSIAKGFAQGFLELAKVIKGFSDLLGGRDLSGIGKWMVRGNILGNALTIFGGLLKGARGIFALGGASLFKGFQAIKSIRELGLGGWLGKVIMGSNAKKTAETMETVTKQAPNIGKFSLGVSKFFKGWAEVATMIGGSAFVAWGSMKLIKGTVKSFKDTVDVLNTVDWDMGKKALIGIGGFLGAMATLSGIAGHFASASGTMLLGELVVGVFSAIALGFADIDMRLVKDTLKQLSDAMKYMNPIMDAINGMKDIGDVGKGKIKKAIETFNELTTLFRGDFNVDTKQWENGLKHFDKDFADSLGNLKYALDAINHIANLKINSGNIETVTTQMGDALASIGTMLETLPEGMGTKGTAESIANLNSITTNLNSTFEKFVGKNGILAQLPKIANGVKGLDSTGVFLDLPSKMKKLGQALTDVYSSLQGIGAGKYFASNIDHFREGLKSLKFALAHLQSIGSVKVDKGIVKKIQTIITNIQTAFDQGKIAELQGTIRNFADSIKTALNAIKDVGKEPIEVDAKVKLSRGFSESVSKVIKTINDKKKEIKKAGGTVKVPIKVHVTFSVSTNLGSALRKIADSKAQIRASGGDGGGGGRSNKEGGGNRYVGATGGMFSRNGVLYRSGGGSVFKPKGVDKIPAMLAEGEYVHKKQATDFWGVDFMRKVNAMDVRGAMQAMLTKAGSATNMGRQSIFNNTVNNNQRITQNISTNNPSFARVQMGRFAGAL